MLQTTTATTGISLTSVIAPGPARVLSSSIELGVSGPAIFEHYACERGERIEAELDLHLVSMHLSPSALFECRTGPGRYKDFVKLEGALSLFPAGMIPEGRLKSSTELVYCAFAPDFIDEVIAEELGGRRPALHVRTTLYDAPLRGLFHKLVQFLQEEHTSSQLYVDSLTHAIAVRSLELHREQNAATHRRVSELPSYAFQRTVELLRANLHENVRLEQLAQSCGYSRGHFLRMFQARTGVTPHEYHMQLRLQHAQSLLASSTESLIDIAAACGFSNQSHLTSVFRRRVGTTPSLFRRQTSSRTA